MMRERHESGALIADTLGWLDRLDSIDSADELMTCMAGALSQFGFTAFVMTRLPRPPQPIHPHFLMNGWPEGWSARYAEAGHHRHDPLAHHCMTTSAAFAWGEIPAALMASAASRNIVQEARAFALNDGFCVPLHTALGIGGLSLAGERLELPPGARHMIQLLAFHACLAVERLPGATEVEPRLSPRERDVLSWVALGKTAPEIGYILGISEHTVGEHLRHVRRKLSTGNAAHSVAQALRLGELKL